MGTQLFNRHTTWTVIFSLLVALGLGACSDVSNAPAPPTPLSPDAKLSSLTVSPGTLAPTFSSDVTNYTVDVDFNVTSVTVTATAQNTGSTMTVNGLPTTSGQSQTITIGAVGSSTPIPIVVTAQNKSQNTYVVTVHRAVNTSLQNLTVSPGTLNPVFAASTTSYSVDVASTVTSVTVNATLQDATATMTVNGTATTSGQNRSITLGVPGSSTLVRIVVQQGSSQTTYLVTVNRAALGGDNNLSALSVTGQILNPAFSPSQISYTVNVASTVTNVTVSATKSDPLATMSGSITAGAGQDTGVNTIQLGGQGTGTPISIVITAQNGNPKTYTIIVNRAFPLSGNNNLSGLVVSAGSLSPAFSSGTTTYAVNNLLNTTTSTTVTATLSDPSLQTMTINGAAATSGTAFGPISLNVGPNVITIVVTAQDGTTKTYTVTVNRPSGNNNLSGLVVSAGSLSPAFSSGTTTYAVNNVPNATTSTTVTATLSAPSTATMTINGAAATSGTAFGPISLNVGPNVITIVVTAQDGTTKTYTVTVNRASSSNNNLSGLVVSAGSLSPAFSSGTTTYAVNNVPNATTSTTVTATLSAPSTATMTINGAAATSGTAFGPISLNVGPNVITIVVTAQDGTTKTYTVTVNRASLSSNNNLSGLVVSAGPLSPTFSSGTTTYDVNNVPNTTTSTTVTATLSAPSTATMTIDGSVATSGTAFGPIALIAGANVISIDVTAQDGKLQTYTVTVTVTP